jgi:hypothetical protein
MTKSNRVEAIINLPEAKERGAAALHIATDTQLTVNEAKALLSRLAHDADGEDVETALILSSARTFGVAGIRQRAD